MPVMAVNNESQHTGDYRSRPRWSAGKKMDAVLRLLRGEPLEALSRELGVEAHRLAAWRDDFLEGGKDALKGQRPDRSPDERALRQAERKVGQLTMENEILRAAAETRGLQIPPAKRPRSPWTASCRWRWCAGCSARPARRSMFVADMGRGLSGRARRPRSATTTWST
jgi:transposase